MTNIFVGNLDITVTEQQLRELFTVHGAVESVSIIEDRDTGEPRGMAFVEMAQQVDAQSAIAALDGKLINGRPARVNEARPKLLVDSANNSTRDHRRHKI